MPRVILPGKASRKVIMPPEPTKGAPVPFKVPAQPGKASRKRLALPSSGKTRRKRLATRRKRLATPPKQQLVVQRKEVDPRVARTIENVIADHFSANPVQPFTYATDYAKRDCVYALNLL